MVIIGVRAVDSRGRADTYKRQRYIIVDGKVLVARCLTVAVRMNASSPKNGEPDG